LNRTVVQDPKAALARFPQWQWPQVQQCWAAIDAVYDSKVRQGYEVLSASTVGVPRGVPRYRDTEIPEIGSFHCHLTYCRVSAKRNVLFCAIVIVCDGRSTGSYYYLLSTGASSRRPAVCQNSYIAAVRDPGRQNGASAPRMIFANALMSQSRAAFIVAVERSPVDEISA
jgi:hypothetical protein